MPEIWFNGQSLQVELGCDLRRAMLENGVSPHNGQARWLNCKGLGTCGTCAIQVDGDVTEPTKIERWRLAFPPHDPDSDLRLACQTHVMGNLRVVKHGGFWGQCITALDPS